MNPQINYQIPNNKFNSFVLKTLADGAIMNNASSVHTGSNGLISSKVGT